MTEFRSYIEALKSDNDMLRELLNESNGDISLLFIENNMLCKLVKEAYEEGYNTGASDEFATHYNNGVAWDQSKSKKKLEE